MEESLEVEVVKLPLLEFEALAAGFGRFESVEEGVEEELKDSTIADGVGNSNDKDDKEGEVIPK